MRWPLVPLDQLFALEIEFHRKLRCEAPGTADDIERMSERHALAGDARDVLAARDSLIRLLGLWPYES